MPIEALGRAFHLVTPLQRCRKEGRNLFHDGFENPGTSGVRFIITVRTWRRYMPVSQLILLVGSNPVPNAVAALCLADSHTQIILVHSVVSREIAERLRDWLIEKLPTDSARPLPMPLDRAGDEYSPAAIQAALRTHLPEPKPNAVVHLHYTGGTKTMTVHAYRTLEAPVRSSRVHFEASYLDPDALTLILDATADTPQQKRPIPTDLRLKMRDFVKLHGWSDNDLGTDTPLLPDLAMALVADHAKYGPKPWDEWISREAIPKTHLWKCSDLLGQLADSPDGLWRKIKLPDTGKYIKSKQKLGNAELEWPNRYELANFIEAIKAPQLSGQKLGTIAEGLNLSSAEKLCEWLEGQWLESAVLYALIRQQDRLGLHECLMNLKPDGHNGFEFDVIAIKGYRLFAFSCTSGEQNKGYLKHKLFEASIRARQMGGDEARVALVCCSDKHQEVQSELEKEFDLKNKIRVFGRPDLANLEGALAHWIESQSPTRNV